MSAHHDNLALMQLLADAMTHLLSELIEDAHNTRYSILLWNEHGDPTQASYAGNADLQTAILALRSAADTLERGEDIVTNTDRAHPTRN